MQGWPPWREAHVLQWNCVSGRRSRGGQQNKGACECVWSGRAGVTQDYHRMLCGVAPQAKAGSAAVGSMWLAGYG